MYMLYMSCSVCAKTLLLFCVYEQRLCHVFVMYVFATHVNWSENRNQSIYCVAQMCMCAKAESCLHNVCVCDVYELQCMRKDVTVVLCIWAKTVLYLCNVYICDVCKLIRKSINWSIYCVASMCICAKAESCLCNVCVCDVYELQHMHKDVAVVLCIWAKTMSCLCSVCICDAYKSIRKSINQLIYCVVSMCICIKAESCLCNVYVCDIYELQRMRKDVTVVLCIWAKTVLYLCNVYICDVCKLIRKSINWLIYCIASMCMCAKAESCLRSICMYIVYEFKVWIKRCYCSVCDCAACKSIWKCEKSIDLLYYVCLYMRKSWVVSSQYIYVCRMWIAACMQRRCCSFMYVQTSMHQWSRCYCLAL